MSNTKALKLNPEIKLGDMKVSVARRDGNPRSHLVGDKGKAPMNPPSLTRDKFVSFFWDGSKGFDGSIKSFCEALVGKFASSPNDGPIAGGS